MAGSKVVRGDFLVVVYFDGRILFVGGCCRLLLRYGLFGATDAENAQNYCDETNPCEGTWTDLRLQA